MDYRARTGAGAGAGAAVLTSWSRSRAKMERLHNTGFHTKIFNISDRGKKSLNLDPYLDYRQDPDPYKRNTDPKHCFKRGFILYKFCCFVFNYLTSEF